MKQRAHFLGCDLNRPHAAVIIEVTHLDKPAENTSQRHTKKQQPVRHAALSYTESGEHDSYPQNTQLQALYNRINGVLRRRMQDGYPGSVLDERENTLTCIIPLSKDLSGLRLKNWLHDTAYQLYSEYHVHLSIGIGNSCQHIPDYRRGFAEANEALQMGQNLHLWKESEEKGNNPLVTHFNDLGVYRYLYKIAHMDDLRDVYQDQVARIDHYDRRKNTDLLDTLETYLECAGNLTKTSERLFVHRNTLIQRLERLQALCDIDMQDRSNWLTLQVAIKVYKLRTSST